MRKVLALLGFVALVAFSAQTARAQNGYDLFQKALAKERGEGNLEEAIQLYQRIVREFPASRGLAAKALVQMGQCYEKLGKTEARKAYERVLRDYADQPEAVEARVRLAALVPPGGSGKESGMVVRRVWGGPEVDILGTPSPDGRYLSYVDWETGDQAIRDLLTGEKRRLTNKGSWFESYEFALHSTVSPDGSQVAYAWYNKEDFFDLRIVGLDGSAPRLLYSNKDLEYVQPAAWSPDGKHILTLFSRKDRTNQIVFVSVADGSVRVLKTLDWRYPQKMSLSPDGRFIAYDFPPREDSEDRDIFLLAADGSQEIPLVQHPANDLYPVWAPDGKRIVFSSDRAGSLGAWVIQVGEGKPVGSPELIKKDVGRISALGFTQKGSYYYGVETGMNDVYIATLDLATGKMLSPPTKAVERFVGSNGAPDWSADGLYLAYLSQRGPVPETHHAKMISIRSLKTGEERELSPRLNKMNVDPGIRWSADARSILVLGEDKKSRHGLYQVDAQTGDVTPVVQAKPGEYFQSFGCSADGKAVFFTRYDPPNRSSSIVVHELETGRETELHRTALPTFSIGRFALSPDGQYLAFIMGDQATRSNVLKVMPAAGGKPREVLRLKEPQSIAWNAGLAWTPDGREILFGIQPSLSLHEQTVELWQIPAEGGQPKKLGLAMQQLRGVRFHPDGRRIAFTAGQYEAEVWMMENFLPAPAPVATGMVVRQVWAEPSADVFGGPSPDGRYLTFVDWTTGDLAIRDLTTGEKRRLTNKGPWSQSEEYALTSALSPNGKQIAYAWFNKDFGFDLRIIGIDGSAPRYSSTLLRGSPTAKTSSQSSAQGTGRTRLEWSPLLTGLCGFSKHWTGATRAG